MARNVYSYLPVPEGLVFEGSTNEEGKLLLPFHRKELKLGHDYEIGIESFTIDSSNMHNVLENQFETWFIKSDNTKISKTLPPSKIATVLELLRSIEGLKLGFDMDFSQPFSHTMDLKKGKWFCPKKLARSLGIAGVDFKPSPLVAVLNPNHSITSEKIGEEDYIAVVDTVGVKFHFPVVYSKSVWNIVSEHSFQSIYFYSDLVVTEIIANVRVPLLGVFPFNELKITNTWRDIEPIWRRVNRDEISECYVQLADSRGRLFKEVRMSLHCRIRRRNLK